MAKKQPQPPIAARLPYTHVRYHAGRLLDTIHGIATDVDTDYGLPRDATSEAKLEKAVIAALGDLGIVVYDLPDWEFVDVSLPELNEVVETKIGSLDDDGCDSRRDLSLRNLKGVGKVWCRVDEVARGGWSRVKLPPTHWRRKKD